jgi:hypothetical protein
MAVFMFYLLAMFGGFFVMAVVSEIINLFIW